MSTDRIEKTVDLKAPMDRVWRALTDFREFGAWFRVALEGPFVEGEITRGTVTYPGYEHLTWQATVVRMERPHLFAFTWHPYAVDPGMDYSGEPVTTVEVRLSPIPGGTRLTLTESGFDALPAHRRAEAFPRNERGWGIQMDNIRTYVEHEPASS